MGVASVIALALLVKGLQAAPFSNSTNNRPCTEFTLPVPVTAQNAEYDVVQVKNNIDAAAFAVDVDTWTSSKDSSRILRNITVSDTFDISVQLCVPPNGTKKDHLQIATHGAFFDKRYWDVAVNPSEYSYVEAALAAGYSILTYDRLGTGSSAKPDANTVVQAPLELEILRGITEMARSGELLGHAITFNESNMSFEKVIHVGHSFGSFLTSALLTTYGKLSDAALITGFILNEHFAGVSMTAMGLEYAAQNDDALFGDRSVGYMVSGTRSALQTGFFSTRENSNAGIGGFEPELLDYGFSIRSSVTATELLSPSQLNLGAASDFEGPIQFVTGEFDFPICRGDCKASYDPAMIKSLYPKVKDEDFEIYLQPGTGHGLTMHRKANSGYKVMLDWLDSHGL
ncbi:MAG: hypothetical protein Q9162_001166 [Coniocarpon cinnabarinum]